MAAFRTSTALSTGAIIGGGVTFTFMRLNELSLEESAPAVRSGPQSYFKYGYPEQSSSFHQYREHSLVYDRSRRIPFWVSETLFRNNTSASEDKSTGNRNQCTFRRDPKIPSMFSATNEDFRKSGWSRGHMAAAGNRKHSQLAMDDTFYLTNILPQDLDNNSGYWNRLEMFCRFLTKMFEEVHVISGPLFLPQHDQETGRNFIKYEVIGANKVAVPTHLFKVVLGERKHKKPAMAVFIIPNKDVRRAPLSLFQVSLEQLESVCGWTFFPKLDRSRVDDMCVNSGCKLISQEKVDMMVLTMRLQSAKTVTELEQVWKDSKAEKDKAAVDLFDRRRTELSI